MAWWLRVEQPQLHQLIRLNLVHHLHADLLVLRAPGRKGVLEHPLRVGLADHRPLVLDAEPLPDLGPVGVGGDRGDAVDHGVGKAGLVLDPVAEVRVPQPGERGEHPLAQVTVALQVVTRHDRERGLAALPAAPQCLGDQAERGPRHRARLEIAQHVRVGHVELAGDVAEVVAALGDRQRHDPGRGRRHPLDDRLRIVGREQVLHDGPDDPRLVGPVTVLDHQRVQAVLRLEDLLHPPVGSQDPDPADAPVERRGPR